MHRALLTGYFALNHTFNNAIIALMTARGWCWCLRPPLGASKSLAFVKGGQRLSMGNLVYPNSDKEGIA